LKVPEVFSAACRLCIAATNAHQTPMNLD
jgi:hypothetical protein